MTDAFEPMPRELACRELVELVTEYLEGTLPERDRELVEEHLAGCPPCRAHLQQMRDTIRLLGALTEEDVDPRARDELLYAFRDWHRR
jgi:anti-sigma factor RsiW